MSGEGEADLLRIDAEGDRVFFLAAVDDALDRGRHRVVVVREVLIGDRDVEAVLDRAGGVVLRVVDDLAVDLRGGDGGRGAVRESGDDVGRAAEIRLPEIVGRVGLLLRFRLLGDDLRGGSGGIGCGGGRLGLVLGAGGEERSEHQGGEQGGGDPVFPHGQILSGR